MPAASLARPLGSSSSHYSLIPIWHPLCAHAQHSFFKIFFFFFPAQLTPSTTFFQRLQNALSQLARSSWSTLFSALVGIPHPCSWAQRHPPCQQSPRHAAPSDPFPSLLSFSSLHTRSVESSHRRRFRTPTGSDHWTKSHFLGCCLSSRFAIPLWTDRVHKLALYPPEILPNGERFNPQRTTSAPPAPPHPAQIKPFGAPEGSGRGFPRERARKGRKLN